MQTIATGELKDIYEARDIIRNSFEIKVYEPEYNDAWEEAYQRFINICK
jgi:sugar (pentulose or hexulose) kinase